jgi:cytochrome b561
MKKTLLLAAALALLPLLSVQAKTAAPAPHEAAPAAQAAPAAPEPEQARAWTVIADKSSIRFHGMQMDTPFSGTVGTFTPVIHFDPDHLDRSKVTVVVETDSLDAGEKERNDNMKSKDWFDVKTFPTARFDTTGFTKTGDNTFTADATLTIRDMTVPVQLPFTLTFSKPENAAADSGKEQAVMTGKMTIDRSKFKLGQGDWADPTVIANDVGLDITVTAVSDSAKPAPAKDAPQEDTTKEKPPTP